LSSILPVLTRAFSASRGHRDVIVTYKVEDGEVVSCLC